MGSVRRHDECRRPSPPSRVTSTRSGGVMRGSRGRLPPLRDAGARPGARNTSLLFVGAVSAHHDGMAVLYESKYARLEVDEARRIVRYVRSAEPFESIDDATRMFDDLVLANDRVARRDLGLLSDVRLAPGRNDEAFEGVVAARRNELFGGFRKRAVLVRTMVGKLQVQRLNRASVTAADVFDDEAAAIAYLSEP
jgi:hypothetical protein